MATTGYFKVVLGRTSPLDVFPYDASDELSLMRAWQSALDRARGQQRYVAAWNPPKRLGAWSDCAEVGFSFQEQLEA
jgi:hypothetical protein